MCRLTRVGDARVSLRGAMPNPLAVSLCAGAMCERASLPWGRESLDFPTQGRPSTRIRSHAYQPLWAAEIEGLGHSEDRNKGRLDSGHKQRVRVSRPLSETRNTSRRSLPHPQRSKETAN